MPSSLCVIDRKPLKIRRVTVVAVLLASTLCSPVYAGSQADIVTELKREIEAMKAEQAKANQRIADLETALDKVAATPTPAPQAVAVAAAPAAAPIAKPTTPSRLTVSGDLRVRYESNFGDEDARDRGRGVVRARLRAAYAVNNWLTLGGQLATGDPDDPNTTDVTLDDFDDKLAVSIDQVYARAKFGGLQVDAGRIAQPFMRTELVWDGDVSPEGIAASYTQKLGSTGAKLKATGMYFIVDEAAGGPDSDMAGGQLNLELPVNSKLKFELAAGYYDYSLRSLTGGDAGDFRTNRFLNGRYLSDFDLFDVMAAVNSQGFGEKWPIRIVGEYVKNLGAADSEDTGFGIDLILGRASKPHDWRFTYGYAQTDVDAVLAAYTHDNTSIATNYLQHTLAIDYTVTPNVILNATLYHFRPNDPRYAGTNDPNDWLNRFRLNALFQF